MEVIVMSVVVEGRGAGVVGEGVVVVEAVSVLVVEEMER